MVIKYVFRMNLRLPDADLEIGDVAVHGEEVYPSDELIWWAPPPGPTRLRWRTASCPEKNGQRPEG